MLVLSHSCVVRSFLLGADGPKQLTKIMRTARMETAEFWRKLLSAFPRE